MNSKSIWLWISVAIVLLVAILFRRQWEPADVAAPGLVFPQLNTNSVASLHLRPRGQLEVRAERIDGAWMLTDPFRYPANQAAVDGLVSRLARLASATFITATELRGRSDADEGFGFKDPLASIRIEPGSRRILIGGRTAPGDQFFLQVVGEDGVHVVDAEFLEHLPKSFNDLRDKSFVHLSETLIDRITVTNGARTFELERDGPSSLWRLVRPIEARANHALVEDLVERLQAVEVTEFVSDSPTPESDRATLQAPELHLHFRRSSNSIALLRFGGSPTNDPSLILAMRGSVPGVVAIPREPIAPWRGSLNVFRDPHLVAVGPNISSVEITARNSTFVVERSAKNEWRVLPDNFPADPLTVGQLLDGLAALRIVEFTKDVVTPIDLPTYGLANPLRKYLLKTAQGNGTGGTNAVVAEIDFGTNLNEIVYVRRADERSVYAVQTNDFLRLPDSAVRMRELQIWNVSEDDVLGVTIRDTGRTRKLLRKARHEWSLAPGSQGVINDLAVEESVRPLCHLRAAAWVAKGTANRGQYGFRDDGYQLVIDLKDNRNLTLEIGGPASDDSAYAAVTLDGELWILELAPAIYRFVSTYLNIPGNL